MNYEKINEEIKKFVNERDWDQFHSPKNLSMALSVEASELVEIYQWQKEEEYKKNDIKINNAVKDELVDIFFYLTRICQKLNIDLNLRPQNLDHDTYYKLTKEYENLA